MNTNLSLNLAATVVNYFINQFQTFSIASLQANFISYLTLNIKLIFKGLIWEAQQLQ